MINQFCLLIGVISYLKKESVNDCDYFNGDY